MNPSESVQPLGLISDVLFVVAAHADDDVLEVLSKTPLWDLVYGYLQNQHFWYMRTAAAFNLPEWLTWQDYTTEKWSDIYNTLRVIREGNGRFLFDGRHLGSASIRLLIEAGFDPSVSNNLALKLAIGYADVRACRILLADDRVRVTYNTRLSVPILSTVSLNEPGLFSMLFENTKTSELVHQLVSKLTTEAISNDADKILELLISVTSPNKPTLEECIKEALRLDRPKVVETILSEQFHSTDS